MLWLQHGLIWAKPQSQHAELVGLVFRVPHIPYQTPLVHVVLRLAHMMQHAGQGWCMPHAACGFGPETHWTYHKAPQAGSGLCVMCLTPLDYIIIRLLKKYCIVLNQTGSLWGATKSTSLNDNMEVDKAGDSQQGVPVSC